MKACNQMALGWECGASPDVRHCGQRCLVVVLWRTCRAAGLGGHVRDRRGGLTVSAAILVPLGRLLLNGYGTEACHPKQLAGRSPCCPAGTAATFLAISPATAIPVLLLSLPPSTPTSPRASVTGDNPTAAVSSFLSGASSRAFTRSFAASPHRPSPTPPPALVETCILGRRRIASV
jgi:hypothetical protein